MKSLSLPPKQQLMPRPPPCGCPSCRRAAPAPRMVVAGAAMMARMMVVALVLLHLVVLVLHCVQVAMVVQE